MTVFDPFIVQQPRTSALPLIFDSPHSGREYPTDFNYVCPLSVLQQAEDSFVDDLMDCAPDHGASLLCATFPRSYIDVNRALTDIDISLIDGLWPGPVRATSRSHAGIGLVRRLAKPGIPLYDRRLSVSEVQARIEGYYKPYHDALARLISDAHYNFGQVWHINAHAMPDNSTADFVLGDRDGTSCGRDFTYAIRDALKGLGYRVSINHPYKGVEILRRHGNPRRGIHSLQLEISKALYWDSVNNIKSSNYNLLKYDIKKLISLCADYVTDRISTSAAAD